MLVLCKRITRAPLRRFAATDDEALFSNDKIESKHRAKADAPWRIALRAVSKIAFYGSACLFAYTYYTYKYETDPETKPLINQYFLNAVKSTDRKVSSIYRILVDPPLDKLLPDMPRPPPGYMIPKTLVLDLKGTLISTEYVFGKGFEIMKRPGLTEFLNRMSQNFEVVIFSDEETYFTQQLAESLDPRQRIFSGKLGKECMAYRKGEFIKDLDYLNRDLKNVIIIEKNPSKVKNHLDNAILLPEFLGDTNDKHLVELIPFLEHIAKDKVPDVREELNKYGHTETGKKYLKKLSGLRDEVMKRQQKGLSGFFTKQSQQKKQDEPVAPLGDLAPIKPPGA